MGPCEPGSPCATYLTPSTECTRANPSSSISREMVDCVASMPRYASLLRISSWLPKLSRTTS